IGMMLDNVQHGATD
nr:hypothetical protein [Tanacetum cinerariifolium]